MPRFAANLSMMYTELPFMERFAAAAADGFRGVEYLFPYAWPAQEIALALAAHGLQQVLFNAPAGGQTAVETVQAWEAGRRGTACLPGAQEEFRAGVAMALSYAQTLNCPRIHLMAGLVPGDADLRQVHQTYIDNLKWAAAQAARAQRDVLIEPINSRDMPGFYLHHQAQAHDVLAQVGASNLRVQMDLYHCQIMEGDLAMRLRSALKDAASRAGIGHIQIAGVPERHEPDVGELNYPYLMALLDQLGYEGWVGCEYRPCRGAVPGGTTSGLAWLQHCQPR
jgi:2-dehydrotetronate isomerase